MWNPFKLKRKKTGHDLTDEDRELSAEVRRIRKETLIAQETAKLLDAQADVKDAEDALNPPAQQPQIDPMVLIALSFLSKDSGIDLSSILGTPAQISETPVQSSGMTTAAPATLISYSDEEIMNILDKLPKDKRTLLKLVPEKLLKVKLREQFSADDDSIQRAIVLIRD